MNDPSDYVVLLAMIVFLIWRAVKMLSETEMRSPRDLSKAEAEAKALIAAGGGDPHERRSLRERKAERDARRQAHREAIRIMNETSSPQAIRTAMMAADHFEFTFVELAAIGREWRGGAFGRKNAARTARDIVYGFYGKFPIVMFNYAYTVGDVAYRKAITGVYTSCMMPVIDLTHEPRNRDSDDFNTESEAFDDTFRVDFDPVYRHIALQAIPPVMMDFLLQHKDHTEHLWFEKGWIFTAQNVIDSYATLEEYETHLQRDFDFMTQLVEMFPPYLAKQLQNPRLAVYGFNAPGASALTYARELLPAIKDKRGPVTQ